MCGASDARSAGLAAAFQFLCYLTATTPHFCTQRAPQMCKHGAGGMPCFCRSAHQRGAHSRSCRSLQCSHRWRCRPRSEPVPSVRMSTSHRACVHSNAHAHGAWAAETTQRKGEAGQHAGVVGSPRRECRFSGSFLRADPRAGSFCRLNPSRVPAATHALSAYMLVGPVGPAQTVLHTCSWGRMARPGRMSGDLARPRCYVRRSVQRKRLTSGLVGLQLRPSTACLWSSSTNSFPSLCVSTLHTRTSEAADAEASRVPSQFHPSAWISLLCPCSTRSHGHTPQRCTRDWARDAGEHAP